MGLNDAVQALSKADALKEKIDSCRNLLSNGETWVWQQQLQRIYQQVLLQDLEYALDCKVEQDLWNYGFKNYISTLQNLVKDKKNPKRTESQAMLTWCLEAASGFYLTLLQEICTAFDLDLSCRRRDSVYGISDTYNVAPNRLIQPNSSSCYYICQHCLVHLGDIARYRNQNRQAESFYRHAVQLSPHSGQPYNQLALLDSSRGDRLGTVFHYVRSVAVKHPFPAAATNLKRMFSRFAEDKLNLEGRNKLTVQEYVALFLKFHGQLYLGGDLTSCSRTIRLLTDTLTAQVATESFTSRKLVQMLAINLYALHRARGHAFSPECDKKWENNDHNSSHISSDQKQAESLILDLMAGSLSALLLPVYTIRENYALLEYFALPAIKLTLDWIHLEPHVLADQAFQSRLQIWPSLCKLLNGLQNHLSSSDQSNKFFSIPLPEDRELHGFLPLQEAMEKLRFNSEDSKVDSPEINLVRASRFVSFGVWLANREGTSVLSAREIPGNDDASPINSWSFEALAGGQAPSSELIRELEQLSLGVSQCPQQPSPSPSDAGSWGGSSTSTPGGAASPPPVPPLVFEQIPQFPEKKAGILKPQGSLEKSRERDLIESVDGGLIVGSGRRGARQNIAMQTILRKGVTIAPDADIKQVSFKTPSPTHENSGDWTNLKPVPNKAVQIRPLSPHHMQSSCVPIPDISSANFSLPPPPLQQLQQQVQARVVHVPPPPMSVLPPMSIPPPSMRPSMTDAPLFVSPESAVLMPSCGTWPNEALLPAKMPDPNPMNAWWPSEQTIPHCSSSGTSSQNPSFSSVNWGSVCPNQQQFIRPQLNQLHPSHSSQVSSDVLQVQSSVMQHHMFLPSSGSVNSLNKSHPSQGIVSPMFPTRQMNMNLPDKKSGDPQSKMQGFSPYSLFSPNNWAPSAVSRTGFNANSKEGSEFSTEDVGQNTESSSAIMGAQSLWSGPGPSPLERLLEQQKQLREGPSPKSGT